LSGWLTSKNVMHWYFIFVVVVVIIIIIIIIKVITTENIGFTAVNCLWFSLLDWRQAILWLCITSLLQSSPACSYWLLLLLLPLLSLNHLIFLKIYSGLVRPGPRKRTFGIAETEFYGAGALPVAKPTASKLWCSTNISISLQTPVSVKTLSDIRWASVELFKNHEFMEFAEAVNFSICHKFIRWPWFVKNTDFFCAKIHEFLVLNITNWTSNCHFCYCLEPWIVLSLTDCLLTDVQAPSLMQLVSQTTSEWHTKSWQFSVWHLDTDVRLLFAAYAVLSSCNHRLRPVQWTERGS